VTALATQVGWVAWRSVRRTLRQPGLTLPPLLFPLMLLAVNSGGLEPATSIPGFPTDRFLDFALAFAFVQGAVFAAVNAGTELARDIESGFFNRLALTPLRAPALLAGHLAGSAALGLVQALVYLGAGLAAGVEVAAGVGGALLIVALAELVSVGAAAFGAFVALRTASAEAVQGSFPLFFVFLFLSSMNMPRELIEVDWFRAVATANPVSYLIEGLRSLVITGWDGEALALGFGVGAAILAVALTAASLSLRTRMART
jgi:ABC-2 type transport system permease protein